MTTFGEILDAADELSVDDQLALVEVLRRRIAQHNRQQIAADVADARAEFAAGKSRQATVSEIMDEADGES